MSVYEVNATVEREGFFPMLLVYGIIPYLLEKPMPYTIHPRRNHLQRNLRSSTRSGEVPTRVFITSALGPKSKGESAILRTFTTGVPVIVFRVHENNWTGTHKFISIDKDAVVVFPHGRRILWSTHVRPCKGSKREEMKFHTPCQPELDAEKD